ncbi:MAG: AAA family ATPase [Candidatus Absconditabacterales bacterium]|nr:AAA family ATPase [Candidatus Absconditabacterales bacterium]
MLKIEKNIDILKKYIELGSNAEQKISFFILTGAQGLGKSKAVQALAKDFLGNYLQNDFLYIKDFSFELQKEHKIKVELKNDETAKILYKDYNYQDLGTREINSWLQQSPSGKAKILFIENIERMTIAAINAFLKTCEEPLANRIIIASTSNKSQILDTIISRAIIIPFGQNDYIVDQNILADLESLVTVLDSDENIYKKHLALVDLSKKGYLSQMLDYLIFYYFSKNDFQKIEKRLKIKKMSKSNVGSDSLLFYGLI